LAAPAVVQYTAFKRLSDHDKAIDEATRLIDAEPYDFDYWWWRARERGSGQAHDVLAPTRSCGVKSFLVRGACH
jgi:hypothetical protein